MLKKMYKTIAVIFERITADEIFMYAAQGSFYIITASIPFMMLFLALLKFIVPITEQEAIAMVKSIVPGVLQPPVETVISELFSKSTAIISITGITAVWSSSRGIAAVERGVKKVYKAAEKKNFFVGVAFSVFYTLLFLMAILITLLLMVFGGTIYTFASERIGWIMKIENILGEVQEIMYFVGLSVFFTFAYRVFAGKGAKFKDQIWGAMFTTFGWFAFSYIFSIYVENFANYSYVYGSLTVLVLMMLWLYSCMIILLLGAEVNVYINERKRLT